MIVKKCVFNYIKCMRHYLAAIALLCIGLLIGIAGFINVSRDNVNSLIDLIDSSVSNSGALNISAFKNTIIAEFRNLPWNNIWQALGQLFTRTFFENTISKAVIEVIGQERYTEAISSGVGNAALSISKGLVYLFIWASVGIILSYIYCKVMVSFDLKMKVSLKKNIIVIIVNYILNITLVALATYLIGLFPLGTLITLIIILLINQALALFKAYLSRTQDSLKFKKIFNFKNVLLLTIGTILMLALYIVILLALIKLSNEVVGFILSLPLLFILSSVINLNAYSYVRDYYSDLRK